MTRRERTVSALYYGILAVLLVSVWLGWTNAWLPEAIGPRISRNSEALLLAIVVTAWIQFGRPHALGRPALTAFASVVLLGGGVALILSDLPSQYRTLNEALIAAAIVVAYVHFVRPLPRWVPWVISGTVVFAAILGRDSALVTDLAETIAVLALTPLALDVVDRRVLQPGRTDNPLLRYVWYAVLVLVPITLTVLEYVIGVDDSPAGDTVRYLVRTTEAPLFLLLLEMFLVIVLPWARGRSVTAATL